MSKAWVTNQLALLTLPEELQEQLSSGALPERDGRLLARHLKANPNTDAAQLLEHLSNTREQEARTKQEERALLQAAKSVPVLTAVNTKPTETAPSPAATPPVLTAVNTGLPAARSDDKQESQGRTAAVTSTPEHSSQAGKAQDANPVPRTSRRGGRTTGQSTPAELAGAQRPWLPARFLPFYPWRHGVMEALPDSPAPASGGPRL
ncbi:hypothetical protein ACTU45_04655 [Streptomyces sp. 24-1644]|uniref:hypothetical protein n=1 Tax=Streptomyces sp. 24-1644 TaxID=3457315 RepID=UPI003FA7A5AA